jgi:hypothetical protein
LGSPQDECLGRVSSEELPPDHHRRPGCSPDLGGPGGSGSVRLFNPETRDAHLVSRQPLLNLADWVTHRIVARCGLVTEGSLGG